MYIISQELHSQEATDFFMRDLKLSLLSLSDDDLNCLYNTEEYPIRGESQYLSIKGEVSGELLAIAKYEYFTKQCVNFHFYARRDLHHTGAPYQIVKQLLSYVKTVLKLDKVILMLPEACTHVMKFAEKVGFEQEGRIKNSYIWRHKVGDLVIYGIQL